MATLNQHFRHSIWKLCSTPMVLTFQEIMGWANDAIEISSDDSSDDSEEEEEMTSKQKTATKPKATRKRPPLSKRF